MKKSKQETDGFVVASAIWYIIASVLGQGTVLLSTRLFTWAMPAEDWGIVQTYGAGVLIINTVIGLNLHISLRNSYSDFPNETKAFASSSLILSSFSCLLLSACAFLLLFAIGKRDLILLLVPALMQSYALFIINFYNAALAMEFRYKLRSFLLCAPNLVHTLLSILLVIFLPNTPALSKIWGNAIGLSFFALVLYCILLYRGKTLINMDYWRYGLSISLPSIAYSLSDLILMQCDRIMITVFISSAATGIYSNAYNIGSILWILSTATGSAWMPWFYRQMDQGKTSLVSSYSSIYIFLFTLAAIGLMLISPDLLKLLTSQEYWGGIVYLPPIIFSSFLMFLYSFPVNTEFYLKQTKPIAHNTIIASVLNLIGNWLLIPKFGPLAAAFTTVFCYVILFVLQWLSAKKMMPGLLRSAPFLLSTAVFAIVCVLFYFIADYRIIRYGLCFAVMLSAWAFLYKKKDFIRSIMKAE